MTLAAKPPSSKMCFAYCGPEQCDCGIESYRYMPSKEALKYTQPVFDNLLERGVPCSSEAALAFTQVLESALREAIQAERAKSKALADAMWQLLDDMGEKGHSVCEAAKAGARVHYEPFNDEPGTLNYTFEQAMAVLEKLHGPARSRK